MRLCICDYSGHPFQVQLSRELARRGHTVLHLHFAEFLTPKARLQVEARDPPSLAIEAISIGRTFAKYGFVKRRFQEVEIGRLFVRRIRSFAPDIVVGCNLPLDSLYKVEQFCTKTGRPFVFWQQDIYCTAIANFLQKRLGLLGRMIGYYYRSIEAKVAARSAAIVIITEDFRATLVNEFHVPESKIHVIENWAPLDELYPQPKVNPWSITQNLADKIVVLYTGTLGLKHNPDLLLSLAEALRTRPATSVVVTSEGPFADQLARHAAEKSLSNLVILPFQKFDVYPEVLGAADVLVALLEADAGKFAVPSKILSYLCARRAIVVSAPTENLASRTVQRAGAGLTVAAGDSEGFIRVVTKLLDDPALRAACAQSGRAYACTTFDIGKICDRFEAIFASL